MKVNNRLQVIIEDHQRQHDLAINPLSMMLNGIIDAAVAGGIANYKVGRCMKTLYCEMLQGFCEQQTLYTHMSLLSLCLCCAVCAVSCKVKVKVKQSYHCSHVVSVVSWL